MAFKWAVAVPGLKIGDWGTGDQGVSDRAATKPVGKQSGSEASFSEVNTVRRNLWSWSRRTAFGSVAAVGCE